MQFLKLNSAKPGCFDGLFLILQNLLHVIISYPEIFILVIKTNLSSVKGNLLVKTELYLEIVSFKLFRVCQNKTQQLLNWSIQFAFPLVYSLDKLFFFISSKSNDGFISDQKQNTD